jgi:hypothetical protein
MNNILERIYKKEAMAQFKEHCRGIFLEGLKKTTIKPHTG